MASATRCYPWGVADGVVVGIDLGTTHSVVAIADGTEARVLADTDGYRLIPSVVAALPSGQVIAGRSARERRLMDAEGTVFSVKRMLGMPFRGPEVSEARKRLPFRLVEGLNGRVLVELGAKRYSLPEISAFVLREVRRVAEDALQTSVERAVITVPANFNELQRSATKAAALIAGIDVLRIINEPTAAALAYGCGRGHPERIVVYDFGGGTFDLSILELEDDVFEVIGTAGNPFLGGDDLDVALAEQMCARVISEHGWDPRTDDASFDRLRAAAEWTKCQLSMHASTTARVAGLGPMERAPVDIAFSYSRAELDALCAPIVAKTLKVCRDALEAARLTPKQIDAVVMVGGSTRLPLVQLEVQKYFQTAPRIELDPDLVVAMGAAVQGYALAGPLGQNAMSQLAAKNKTGKRSGRASSKPAPALPRLPTPSLAPRPVSFAPPAIPLPERPSIAAQHRAAMPPPVPEDAQMLAITRAAAQMVRRSGEIAAVVHAFADERVSNPGPSRPQLPMGRKATPILMDVTPHALGIETAGGYCQLLIRRNAPLPTEQVRVFTTAKDDQDTVRIRICQGESKTFSENQILGEIELVGVRRARRGTPRIQVAFILDGNGILESVAKDLDTGKEQTLRINLSGGMSLEELDEARARHEEEFTS